jgi:hypothetical protein
VLLPSLLQGCLGSYIANSRAEQKLRIVILSGRELNTIYMISSNILYADKKLRHTRKQICMDSTLFIHTFFSSNNLEDVGLAWKFVLVDRAICLIIYKIEIKSNSLFGIKCAGYFNFPRNFSTRDVWLRFYRHVNNRLRLSDRTPMIIGTKLV